MSTEYIDDISIDSGLPNGSEVEIAIFDLIESNTFRVTGNEKGPYVIRIGKADSRFLFRIFAKNSAKIAEISIPLSAIRKIRKDYDFMVQSFHDSIRMGNQEKTKAIDADRKKVHMDAAQIIVDEFKKNGVETDITTGKHMFTLFYALTARKSEQVY